MQRRGFLKVAAAAAAAPALPSRAAQPASHLAASLTAYSYRNQLKSRALSYADLIRIASDAGARGLDLTAYWLPDTSDNTLLPLRRAAYRAGVDIYTIGVRAYMCRPTAEAQAAEAENVRKWADAAARLGASHMRVFGGPVPKGASEQQAIGWAVETLKRCADVAGAHGVIVGVEDDGGLTTNAAPTIAIVRGAASTWAGINLDIGNFPTNGYEQIAMCAPLATNVHFKPRVHEGGGEQPVDTDRVLKILAGAGYRGFVSLEYELSENAETEVPKLLRMLADKTSAAASAA